MKKYFHFPLQIYRNLSWMEFITFEFLLHSKEKEDLEDISQTRAMDATSMKNVVVQNLLEGKQETGGEDSKEHLVTHTIF